MLNVRRTLEVRDADPSPKGRERVRDEEVRSKFVCFGSHEGATRKSTRLKPSRGDDVSVVTLMG